MSARTIAAALTPLQGDGRELDLDVFEPYLIYLRDAGIDGILLAGTTGEGISLSLSERKSALARCVGGPLPVLAHCGAQTTADTVALAAHAAESGAEAVAVIAPPYFQLDDDALLAHFVAAARACAPLPFYAYELEKASGYAIPVEVVERLRDAVDNLVGMKVSDAPFSKVQPYLLEGLDVFIGAESLIGEGLAAGAAGAVSGLAGAFPEVVVEARAQRRLDARRGAAAGDRALPAPRGVEGGRGGARRADAGGRARTASPPHGRRTSQAPRRSGFGARLGAFAELVDRLTGARLHVGPAGIHVGRLLDGRLAGLELRALGLEPLRGLELRAQVLGKRRRESGPAAAAQKSAEPQAARNERKQALHRGDATLPPLLATPVAPSSEAAYRRRGRFSP